MAEALKNCPLGSAVQRWKRLPRLGDRPVQPVTLQHEWDPPHHKAADQLCCCLRCGCRTHRPQQVSPCPELQAANLPLLDPLCVEPNPRLPYDPDQAVAALNQQVRWLWTRVKELEARHG